MTHRFFMEQNGTVGEYHVEGTKVHRRLLQSNRKEILERNKEIRRNPGAIRTTSFGKLELDIPIPDMKMLDKFFPGIANPAHPDHKWQLRKFMKSPASDPYRLHERKRWGSSG